MGRKPLCRRTPSVGCSAGGRASGAGAPAAHGRLGDTNNWGRRRRHARPAAGRHRESEGTRAMAEAWSKDGITANAIGPGFFRTELTAAVFGDPERAARNAAQTCIGRNGEVEDMDGPLLFFCSDACAYVTGQVLMVDGGFTAK